MGGVGPEQIERAKQVDILDYVLAREPDNVKRVGNAHYLKDHGSFEISNGLWNWHSRGIGGKNVIDYLMKVRGYGFVDAVCHLAGVDLPPRQQRQAAAMGGTPPGQKPADSRPFTLPPRNGANGRVIAYLQGRGIDRDIIEGCINRGVLYESAVWHNCAFVGRDDSGKARYAALRGTSDDTRGTPPFKRDAYGSDKRFGFCLPPVSPHSDTVFVFESPIDLLSYDTLCKLGNIGPQDGQPLPSGWRLSLGGTAMAALAQFIEQRKFNSPIAHCVVCTDNDAAGNAAFSEIAEKLTIGVSRQIPVGKDWNETLQQIRKEVEPLEDVRKDILFLEEPFKYPEAFRIKDGDSVKVTYAYDGEAAVLKCRYIDEAHLYIGNNAYHISELAEKLKKNGDKVEPLPGQKPKLNILAAKYGEPLQDVEIPMTDAAIKKLVGGKYEIEPLYVDGQGINGKYGPYAHDAIVRGKDGIAVCGIGGDNSDIPTSLHPYHAKTYKRELSPAEPPKKPSMLGRLEEAKAEAAVRGAAPVNESNDRSDKPKKRGGAEIT